LNGSRIILEADTDLSLTFAGINNPEREGLTVIFFFVFAKLALGRFYSPKKWAGGGGQIEHL